MGGPAHPHRPKQAGPLLSTIRGGTSRSQEVTHACTCGNC